MLFSSAYEKSILCPRTLPDAGGPGTVATARPVSGGSARGSRAVLGGPPSTSVRTPIVRNRPAGDGFEKLAAQWRIDSSGRRARAARVLPLAPWMAEGGRWSGEGLAARRIVLPSPLRRFAVSPTRRRRGGMNLPRNASPSSVCSAGFSRSGRHHPRKPRPPSRNPSSVSDTMTAPCLPCPTPSSGSYWDQIGLNRLSKKGGASSRAKPVSGAPAYTWNSKPGTRSHPARGPYAARCFDFLILPVPSPDPRPQTPDPRPQTPDPRPQTPDPRPQTPDPRPQTPDPRPQTPDPRPQTRNSLLFAPVRACSRREKYKTPPVLSLQSPVSNHWHDH